MNEKYSQNKSPWIDYEAAMGGANLKMIDARALERAAANTRALGVAFVAAPLPPNDILAQWSMKLTGA